MIVINIKIQRTTITIAPPSGDFRPKNTIDHKTLKASWTKKIIIAFLAFAFADNLFQTRKRAIPINKNNIVQTGAKIQFGGLKDGLLIVLYHVAIEGEVKIEPKSPAPSQINTLIINLIILLIFYSLIIID